MRAFEARVHEFQEFVRPIDKRLHERVIALITQTNLVESIVGIEVSLRIAVRKYKLSFGAEIANTLLFQLPYISNFIKRRKLFSEEVIPIKKIIISIGRLRSLVAIAKETYINRWSHDSDVFRPANLDEEQIIKQIEAAIENIEEAPRLSKEEKKELIEYLSKAKSEFSEDRPSWNKIVGALVIAAAIVSGVADANGALQNIDATIRYILGHSVERHLPSPVPLLKTRVPAIEDGSGIEATRL